jgi:hypothetical protein
MLRISSHPVAKAHGLPKFSAFSQAVQPFTTACLWLACMEVRRL